MKKEDIKRIGKLTNALKEILPKNIGIFIFDTDIIKPNQMEEIMYAIMELNVGFDLPKKDEKDEV